MVAPPVKAPQPKMASPAVPTRAPQSPQHMPWRPGVDIAARSPLVQPAGKVGP